jgi:phospholipid/cholesterol/gamma-HCH transport system substrate-binding protein
MQRNIIETLVGAFVLVVAGIFAFFSYNASNVGATHGYVLTAQFDNLDGINAGTDVKIAGIKIGSVNKVTLDPKTYLATLFIEVQPEIPVPADTVAVVATEGLLGGRYIKLLPGASDDVMKPNARFQYTQGPVDIAELLGKVFFSAANNTAQRGDKGPKPPAAPVLNAPEPQGQPAPSANDPGGK